MSHDIRLLVRADDAGSSWASNMGCLRACTEGIARSVEVMMPGAWITHAARLFNQHPEIDIGIHLTLTSEWDDMKWRPLTAAESLTDENGHFLPLLVPRQGDDRPCLADANWSIDDIAAEFRTQISRGMAMFRNVSHVSSHMVRHFKDFDPKVGEVVSDLCDVFGLADDAFGYGLQRIKGYPSHPREVAFRVSAFKDALSDLSDGTYIFIDHPAVHGAELEAVGHVGYADVASDRAACFETLISKDVRWHLEHMGVKLISYPDL